jgi:hypothetical protein
MEQIKSELVSLRLSGMAEALKTLQEGRKIHELTLTDGLRLLVQAERDQREANRYKRLVKNASFRYRASLEELSFDTARGLDRTQILSLANGSYIRDAGSILITGATGCGKSFVATDDLVEDTNWTFEELEKEGFSKEIIEVLKLITKESDNEDYSNFIQRVMTNKTAISVKLNDLRDNMDITRLKELTNNDLKRLNKYLKAYRLLIEQQ